MPAVVCEIGFINHEKEGVYITSQEGLEEIGQLPSPKALSIIDSWYTKLEKKKETPRMNE